MCVYVCTYIYIWIIVDISWPKLCPIGWNVDVATLIVYLFTRNEQNQQTRANLNSHKNREYAYLDKSKKELKIKMHVCVYGEGGGSLP